jgi:hypothetical protein
MDKLILEVIKNPCNETAVFKLLSLPKLALEKIPKLPFEDNKAHNLRVKQAINNNLDEIIDNGLQGIACLFSKVASKNRDSDFKSNMPFKDFIIKKTIQHVADGQFTKAMNTLLSNGKIKMDEQKYQKLQQKFPLTQGRQLPPISPNVPLHVTPNSVRKAIYSFPKDTTPGPDGWKVEHLKAYVENGPNSCNVVRLQKITDFINLLLKGAIAKNTAPIFCAATLLVYDENLRPIACTPIFRRLTSKVALSSITKETIETIFESNQMGVKIPSGGEALIHALQQAINKHKDEELITMKLDFSNAFNSCQRTAIFTEVSKYLPAIYNWTVWTYDCNSTKYINDRSFQVSEGVDQGDPISPLLFCLVLNSVIKQVKTECNLKLISCFIDDAVALGTSSQLNKAIQIIQESGKKVNLTLNLSKSENFCP